MLTESKTRVAVLGSGVVGLHLALLFREQGYHVSVFSSKTKNKASLASHGLVCHKGHVLPHDKLFSLKVKGALKLASRIRFLEKNLGEKIPLNQGVFEAFETKKEELFLRRRAYHEQFIGCFQSEIFTGAQFSQKTPFLSKNLGQNFTSSLFYPLDFSFDPQVYLSFLKIYLKSQGVLFEEAELSSFSQAKKGLFVLEKDKKHSFKHLLCALGASTQGFLKASGFDLEPLFLSGGFTLRASFERPQEAFSVLLKRKNFSFFGDRFVLGSFPSEPREEELVASFPGLFRRLSPLFSAPPALFAGERVFTKSRSPLLQCFQLDNGSKVLVLTGMYKNGFALSEIFAEKALSFF